MIKYRYTELAEDVAWIFEIPEQKDTTTEKTENAFFYARLDDEPNMFYDVLAVTVYEIKHNILTPGMKKQFLNYAERFDKGEFQPDMIPEDIPIVTKDIAFVRSKISV